MTQDRQDLNQIITRLRELGHDLSFRETEVAGYYQLYEQGDALMNRQLTAAGCIKFFRDKYDFHEPRR